MLYFKTHRRIQVVWHAFSAVPAQCAGSSVKPTADRSARAWPSAAGSHSLLSARRQPETNRQSAAPRRRETSPPYCININRHINNRVSTCAVIYSPPVNTLARPSLRCPVEARRQGCVWECTVPLGAADGLGAGCCRHKAVEGSAGAPEHHSSIGATCHTRAKPSPLPERACSNHHICSGPHMCLPPCKLCSEA